MLKIAIAAVAAMSLSACAPQLAALGVGGSTAKSDLHEFLTDPNCSHDDEATFVSGAGGIPASFQAKVARHCPVRDVSREPTPAAPPQ